MMRPHNYFVYITTNKNRSVLYTGVTNNLARRLFEHEQDAKTIKKHFAGRYQAYLLLYWEYFQNILQAIEREKQIKSWSRLKKENLIVSFNPNWQFLNKDMY